MSQISKLIRQRNNLKAKLVRINKFLDLENVAQLEHEVRVRYNDMVNIWSNFEDIQTQIEELNEVEDDDERTHFEAKYYSTKARMEAILTTRTTREDTKQCETQISNQVSSVKLPKLELPKFGGDIRQWPAYKNIFYATVDKADIPTVSKLQYLKSTLQGEAAGLISSLLITEENYSKALNTLCQRYENKSIIVNYHLKSIVNYDTITKLNLKDFLSTFQQSIDSLQAVQLPVDSWDALLVFIISQKLDNSLRAAWELNRKDNTFATLSELLEFLNLRRTAFELIGVKQTTVKSSHISNVKSNISCIMCQQEHNLQNCPTFLELSVPDRIQFVKSKALCFNCLHKYKIKHKCSKFRCRFCRGLHNSVIHDSSRQKHSISTVHSEPSTSANTQSALNSNNSVSQQPHVTPAAVLTSTNNQNEQILLSTAIIRIQDASGKWMNARCLLDSGSEINIVTRRLASLLQLKYNYHPCTIQGVGNSHNQSQVSVTTNISSRHNKYTTNLTFLLMDNITVPLPQSFINTQTWNIPNKLVQTLADPTFFKPSNIDLLIGAEMFYNILQTGRIKLGPSLPLLIETTFGWIVSGAVRTECLTHHNNTLHTSLHITTQTTTTDSLLKAFWEQEEISNTKKLLSPEDKYCEDLYQSTTTQDQTGRYIVNLPIQKEKLPELGNSFNTAYRYLIQLETRFQKDTILHAQYKAFINEFVELGHACYIDKFSPTDSNAYYLPHFPIIKPEARSTKLRTVFHASSESSTGLSLNSILYEGPNIYNDLLDIILRFRLNQFVFSCDIIKMFRGISINPEQQSLQRILWRESSTEPVKCLELTTVTYGTKCAPYLACRTMLDLAEKHSHTHPLAAQCIKYNSYMDDYLSGAQSIEECIEICSQLINLLNKAGFSLHKWTSNNAHILQSILPSDTAIQSSEMLKHTDTSEASYSFTSDTVKTLGLKWTPTQDTLQLSLPTQNKRKNTKRHILSQISQIFDPIGILAPTTILAKILMQDIWKENMDWDSVIPPELESRWIEFITQLHYLQVIQIPRWYFTDLPINIYLIGFCDASSKAYGACLYLKATYNQKPSTCTLVMAKSKVAPIKRKLSIPKLELAGAVMLSKMSKKFTESIQNKTSIDKIYLFSDSNIVLCWIKSPYKHTHDSYTSHRLMQIINMTQSENWYYINTKQNPADLITRGVMPQHLPSCTLWWQGTPWLAQDQDTWPISTSIPENETSKQNKQEKVVHTVHKDSSLSNSSYFYDLFYKHSNFTRLIRTIAYMFRFIHNARNKSNKITSHLSISELNKAHDFVIRTTQLHAFHKEILYLQPTHTNNSTQHLNSIKHVVDTQSSISKPLHSSHTLKSSPIRKLNPFLDGNQLIRVGGRIQHSDISYNNAHPIILPSKDHITTLIVQHYHLKLLHSGIQSTLHNIRLKYWPINGRNEVKKVIHTCVRCIRFGGRVCGQQMASLPPPRVTLTRAFQHVGVDFSGAISIRSSMGRNCKYSKGYICLFICLATRAIHLELVTDLSAQAYINALRRLIFRRSIPICLYTDNASNFRGSKSELHDLYKMFKNDDSYSKIVDFYTSNSIDHKFTIPLASHMGGIYESGIKSVKTLLKRHLSSTKLTYELLYTVLVQIEGILNSRPLSPITDIPNDVTCLTPAHFIVGAPITDLPEPSMLDYKESRLNVYQRIIQIKQRFWKEFYCNYLSELQTRNKWLEPKTNLQIGDLVIIKEDITPPTCWPLGRVISVNTNKTDKLVRSVTVRTSSKEYVRPIHKLIKLF